MIGRMKGASRSIASALGNDLNDKSIKRHHPIEKATTPHKKLGKSLLPMIVLVLSAILLTTPLQTWLHYEDGKNVVSEDDSIENTMTEMGPRIGILIACHPNFYEVSLNALGIPFREILYTEAQTFPLADFDVLLINWDELGGDNPGEPELRAALQARQAEIATWIWQGGVLHGMVQSINLAPVQSSYDIAFGTGEVTVNGVRDDQNKAIIDSSAVAHRIVNSPNKIPSPFTWPAISHGWFTSWSTNWSPIFRAEPTNNVIFLLRDFGKGAYMATTMIGMAPDLMENIVCYIFGCGDKEVIADAGLDQTVYEGDVVWYDGSNSSQSNPPSFSVDGIANAIDVRGSGKSLIIGGGVYTVNVSGSWTDAGTGRVITSAWILHGLNRYPAFPWVEELIVGESYVWDTSGFSYRPYFFLLGDSSTGNSGVITIHFAKDGVPLSPLSLDASVNVVNVSARGIHRTVSGDFLRLTVSGAWDNGPSLAYPKPFVYTFSGSSNLSIPWVQTLFSGELYEFPVTGREHLTYFFLDQHTGDNSGEVTVGESALTFFWDMNDHEDTDGDGDSTNDVDRTGPTPNYTYGDNGEYTVWLTVRDWNGREARDSVNVTVLNLAPSISEISASLPVNVTVRIAGEKWHDLQIDLTEGGSILSTATLVREPGKPQEASVEGIVMDLEKSYQLRITYTPENDPINGRPYGASPAWVVLTHEDGDETRLHHTFNVRLTESWVWNVSLNQMLVGKDITFQAAASDPGSDDITFEWDWGDGAKTTQIYYNNGVSPDPPMSPGGSYPFTVTDTRRHGYAAAGSYTITLTVTDDDGATVSISRIIVI